MNSTENTGGQVGANREGRQESTVDGIRELSHEHTSFPLGQEIVYACQPICFRVLEYGEQYADVGRGFFRERISSSN